MNEPQPFDLLGPLPRGRVAIEASAGTGKTYTLAALATREVVETGIGIDELLIVTFTRAAAAELRERVRARLVDAERALRGVTFPADDPLLAHLTAVSPEEVVTRLHRVREAINSFDAASITTIHGFASQVLATLGTSAPGDPDATLVDDAHELVSRTAADVLGTAALLLTGATLPALDDRPELATLAGVLIDAVDAAPDVEPVALLPSLDVLAKTADKVLGNPGIAIVPGIDVVDVAPTAAVKRALVDAVAAGVSHHRRAAGTLSYDEVLTQVRDALHVPGSGDLVRASLRRRFRIALIDEFQDTDPVQWDIFSSLFDVTAEQPEGALVLVGDPKQAIYAFRGANVDTYLAAAHGDSVQRSTLATNWRSTGGLLAGLESLLGGMRFGDERIEFLSVAAAPSNEAATITDSHGRELPPVKLRLATGLGVERGRASKAHPHGRVSADGARRAIAADLAVEVRSLLDGAQIPAGDQGAMRPVRPDDIAVLIRSHSHAHPVKAALTAHGIPTVIAKAGPVSDSPAADQLRMLLRAVASPSSPPRARALALSWFYGWTPEQLDAATDDDLGAIHQQLQRWSERLASTSFTAFAGAVWSETGVVVRRLGTTDGDREVTDLDHLVEVLHSATGGRPSSPSAVLAALDELGEGGDEDDRDLVARRVETAAPAVQIVTIHGSKGLEFPIVCCPSLHEIGGQPSAKECIYRDPATGRRTIDVANETAWEGPTTAKQRLGYAKEDYYGEGLRLAYVALTRAQHQVITWWANTSSATNSPMATVLFARPPAFDLKVPADTECLDALAHLEGPHLHLAEVAGLAPSPATRWEPPDDAPPAAATEPRALGRTLDRSRTRWSFTSVTRHDRAAETDPYDQSDGDAGASDESADVDAAAPPAAPASAKHPLPLGDVPGSAEFGTLVHSVLELVDFTAPDLDAALDEIISDLARWNDWPVELDVVRRGIRAAIDSPLGPRLADLRLRDIARADRLDELTFELHLAEGPTPATVADIGHTVLAHLPPTDPLVPWAKGLAEGQFPVTLAGHLTGSIDAVLRVPGPDGASRYVVVDYKTNTLAERGDALTIDHYAPSRLPSEMAHHHYPLQALLYSVALHRYLRWRLTDYDPAVHLGGAAYLFVRGMIGATTPLDDDQPYGVFSWDVPGPLVVALSDLLHGTREATP